MEQTIWQEYQDDGVIVWGINFHESPEVIEEFVETFGLTFPILLDPNGFVYHRYLEGGELCNIPFPLDYIVDPEGLIAYRACEYFPDSMLIVIDEILAEEDGAPFAGHEPPGGHVHARGESPGLRIETVSPNPLRHGGAIRFALPSRGNVLVDVLDAAGRRVRRLHQGRRPEGSHMVFWDGRDASGRPASGGLYLLRVASRGKKAARKVLLIR